MDLGVLDFDEHDNPWFEADKPLAGAPESDPVHDVLRNVAVEPVDHPAAQEDGPQRPDAPPR